MATTGTSTTQVHVSSGPENESDTAVPTEPGTVSEAWHKKRGYRILLAALPFLALLGIWQWIANAGVEALRYAVPTPADTFRQMGTDLSNSAVYSSIWTTIQEFLIGLSIGAVTGIIVGAFLGLVPLLYVITWPAVVFFQAIPKIALAPLMIIIFGFGIGSKVALAASISFFPILVGVIGGVRSVRSEEIDLLRSLKASKWQQFATIRIPRALPSTFGGFQVGAVFALMAAVVTEFLGASSGIGYLIQLRSSQLQTPGVFSGLIILSAIGVAVSLVLESIGNRLSQWDE